MHELTAYLEGAADVRDSSSNKVYVVSLGSGPSEVPGFTFQEIVEKKRRYWYPARKGWPKQPPNYIGFRYGGRLQSIHHVDGWRFVSLFSEAFPDTTNDWGPVWVLDLGEPIRPAHEVRTGPGIIRNMHAEVDLDLLLTRGTISSAWEETKRRRQSGTVVVDVASEPSGTFTDWNGREVTASRSASGVLLLDGWEDNLIRGDARPWPPPALVQKLYKARWATAPATG